MDLEVNVEVDYFVAEKPLESVNGDIAFVNTEQEQIFFGIVDGAGHGHEAHLIAQASRTFLEKNKDLELPTLMKGLHEELRNTRGGVVIIGRLDTRKLQLRYVGIGNIVLRIFGIVAKTEIAQGGIVGYQIRTPHEKTLQLSLGDVVVMHTDGIISHFDINDYPRVLKDDSKTIARNLIDKFSKNDDDATCLIIRFK